MEASKNESFRVHADITGDGIDLELEVQPEETKYIVRLDGIMLTTLEYESDTFPHWRQIAGKLDRFGVIAVGDAIEHNRILR